MKWIEMHLIGPWLKPLLGLFGIYYDPGGYGRWRWHDWRPAYLEASLNLIDQMSLPTEEELRAIIGDGLLGPYDNTNIIAGIKYYSAGEARMGQTWLLDENGIITVYPPKSE